MDFPRLGDFNGYKNTRFAALTGEDLGEEK